MPTDSTNDTPSLDQELDALFAEGDTASEDATTEGDQATDSPDTESDEVDAASESSSDEDQATDEPADTFTVKVRGKEQEVTLDELLKGYQRQSDYTKGKQEVAQERQEAAEALNLVEALRNDPEATLRVLAENLLLDDTDQTIDPLEQRLNQHEQFIAQQQEQQVLAQVDAEMQRLEGLYPDQGFDREAVLEWAIDNNQPDLEAAWLKMQVETQRNAAIDQRNQEAASRKKNAPPVAGRSKVAGTQAKATRGQAKSIQEALDRALDDLDTDFDHVSWGSRVVA